MLPLAAAGVLVLFVVAGQAWRHRSGVATRQADVAGGREPPLTTGSPGAARRPPSGSSVTELPAARADALSRIRGEAAGTYLAAMLESSDSALHRWPSRGSRALRVAVVLDPGSFAGGEHISAVNWALSRWNDLGLPLRLEPGGDSAGADIVVRWVATLQQDGTGRADVTWNGRGEIERAVIALAVRFADGPALVSGQRSALALHELGHALGLGHSPHPEDAMHPTTEAVELSDRDRRTATLLYSLPTGSLKGS